MPLPRYVEPILGAMALTSVTTHLVVSRQAAAEERSKLIAQTSILSELVDRARRGERISDMEYSRLLALASLGNPNTTAPTESGIAGADQHKRGTTSWKEVLLGRKPSEKMSEQLDEEARLEWEAGTGCVVNMVSQFRVVSVLSSALLSNSDVAIDAGRILSAREENARAGASSFPSHSQARRWPPAGIYET